MDIVTGLSLGRIAAGAPAFARPDLVSRILPFDPAQGPQTSYVTRLVGARDVVVGAVTLLARGQARRPLILAGIAIDAADVAAGYLARRDHSITRTTAAALVAPAALAVGAGLAGLRQEGWCGRAGL